MHCPAPPKLELKRIITGDDGPQWGSGRIGHVSDKARYVTPESAESVHFGLRPSREIVCGILRASSLAHRCSASGRSACAIPSPSNDVRWL